MNRKSSLIIASTAFVALVHPLSRLMSFADDVICLAIAHAGCVNPPWSLLSELVVVLFNHFGARTAQLVLLVFPFAVALVPAVLVYVICGAGISMAFVRTVRRIRRSAGRCWWCSPSFPFSVRRFKRRLPTSS